MPAERARLLTVYGLRGCDTCRKALSWLDEHGVEYAFVDLRRDGVDAETIGRWLRSSVGSQLLNRRSTTWRQLPLAEQQRAETDPARIISQYPTLVKRPVFVRGKQVLALGFDPAGLRLRLLS